MLQLFVETASFNRLQAKTTDLEMPVYLGEKLQNERGEFFLAKD